MMRLTVPLPSGKIITVEGEFPISYTNWSLFMDVLEAMRPGLTDHETEPS